jgi:hypothetical protein
MWEITERTIPPVLNLNGSAKGGLREESA